MKIKSRPKMCRSDTIGINHEGIGQREEVIVGIRPGIKVRGALFQDHGCERVERDAVLDCGIDLYL